VLAKSPTLRLEIARVASAEVLARDERTITLARQLAIDVLIRGAAQGVRTEI
jgi:hypothetical protein